MIKTARSQSRSGSLKASKQKIVGISVALTACSLIAGLAYGLDQPGSGTEKIRMNQEKIRMNQFRRGLRESLIKVQRIFNPEKIETNCGPRVPR
jgi:hypothetical protein